MSSNFISHYPASATLLLPEFKKNFLISQLYLVKKLWTQSHHNLDGDYSLKTMTTMPCLQEIERSELPQEGIISLNQVAIILLFTYFNADLIGF